MEVASLRAAADAEGAAYARSQGRRERAIRAWRLFEICCAYEQVNADLCLEVADHRRQWCHDAAMTFAGLASQLAGQLLSGETGGGLDDGVARCVQYVRSYASGPLGAAQDVPERYVRLPECFMRDLLDLAAYAGFAHERLVELAPRAVVVVGIRTSGSYLAPVWDAVLDSNGLPRIVLTARPKRNPRLAANGRFTDASPGDRWLPPEEDAERLTAFLDAYDPRTVSAVVIDDLAFTGSQFVRVDNYLRGLGVEAASVVYIQDTPLVMTSLTPTGYERLSSRQVWSAPRVADGPRPASAAPRFFCDLVSGHDTALGSLQVVSARLAPPTFSQRYLAAGTAVPVDEFMHFNPRGRDRHYLVEARLNGRPVRLFAKLLGTGLFAEQELHRIRQFADVGYHVVAHVGGFLFYEWITGEPLGPGDGRRLTDDDLDQLAAYAALLGRLNKNGHVAPDSYANEVLGRLRAATVLTSAMAAGCESVASDFAARVRGSLPIVDAPRNQGYWHHIRAIDGRLRRVHLDLGEWSWRMDVAEELAAAVVELQLSPAQTARLVAGYMARTGDADVASRMTMATMSYVARILDMYQFWAGQLEQIPRRYWRPADDPALVRARSRQASLLCALEQALVREAVSGA